MNRWRTRAMLCGAALLWSVWLPSCGSDAQKIPRQIQDFVNNVGTSDGASSGALVQGAPPSPNGGPTASTEVGSGAVITGGNSSANVTADADFATVLVAVDGADGYYQLSLADPVREVRMVISFGQDITETSFTYEIAVVSPDGRVGAFTGRSVSVTHVDSGALQVTVGWDAASDIDLRVIDPAGDEISFENRTVDSGGRLDFDSNTGCEIDNVNAESIGWGDSAPAGTYTVVVDLFDDCGTQETNYGVSVVRADGSVESFGGVYDAETQGDIEQHTFTFVVGEP